MAKQSPAPRISPHTMTTEDRVTRLEEDVRELQAAHNKWLGVLATVTFLVAVIGVIAVFWVKK